MVNFLHDSRSWLIYKKYRKENKPVYDFLFQIIGVVMLATKVVSEHLQVFNQAQTCGVILINVAHATN